MFATSQSGSDRNLSAMECSRGSNERSSNERNAERSSSVAPKSSNTIVSAKSVKVFQVFVARAKRKCTQRRRTDLTMLTLGRCVRVDAEL